MKLSEAKEILEQQGYICEVRGAGYVEDAYTNVTDKSGSKFPIRKEGKKIPFEEWYQEAIDRYPGLMEFSEVYDMFLAYWHDKCTGKEWAEKQYKWITSTEEGRQYAPDFKTPWPSEIKEKDVEKIYKIFFEKGTVNEAIAKLDENDTHSVDLDADKFQRRVLWNTSNDEMLDMIFAYLKEEKGFSNKFCNFWHNRCEIKNYGSGAGGHGYMDFGEVKKTKEELEAEKKKHGYVWSGWVSLPNYKIEGRTFADLGEQCYKHMVKMLDQCGKYPELVKINEASEPDYMNGEFSYWDRRRMDKGYAPSWAKSMKTIGPRKQPIRQSSSHTETAMRKVTNPNEQKPYTSADWKEDQKLNKISNQKIFKALQVLIPVDLNDYSIDENDITLDYGNYLFRITSRGPNYYVIKINPNSVLDRKSKLCKSFDEISDFIKTNLE